MENHSFADIVGSSAAPFINGTILPGCGLATNFTAETHPSLPNYLAATSGSTLGVTSDCSPASCPQAAVSIFEQVQSAGLTWRAYNESMPANCAKTSSGLYAQWHNPAVYYTNIAAACQQFDVPATGFAADVSAGRLPSFSVFTPNLCNDMHDCSISTGDTFLKGLVNTIVAGPNYRSGDTAVFLTWDEGAGSNNIVTAVLSGSTPAGTKSATAFNHYSMLRTAEDLLGVGRLGNAAGATSMATAFGLR
jgi:phospholipase C